MTRDIEGYWSSCALAHWTGNCWWVDDSSQIPTIVVKTDQLVSDIARSTGDQFRVQKDRQGSESVKPTVLGQRILDWAQRFDVAMVCRHLNRHSFSPYFDLLKAFRDESGMLSSGVPPPALVPQANQWVDSVRAQSRDPLFIKAVESREAGAKKNEKSARQYVGALLRRYSTLMVASLDIGYHHDPLRAGPNWALFSDDQVNVHLKQLRSFIRGKLPGIVGLVWRIAYSAVRGHYCHLMLFFDGCLAFDRSRSGPLVAEQWAALTRAYGTCWNWNAVEPSRQRHVIGTISVFDEDACRRLVQEAMFLARLDYYARFESITIKRTFGKGEITGKLVLREPPRKAVKLRITRAMASV
jgi:hypothetical protein